MDDQLNIHENLSRKNAVMDFALWALNNKRIPIGLSSDISFWVDLFVKAGCPEYKSPLSTADTLIPLPSRSAFSTMSGASIVKEE